VLRRKLSRAVVRSNGVPTVAQRRWCGGGKGAAALEVLGRRRSRVRVRGGSERSFCRAAAMPRRAGPGEGARRGYRGPLRRGGRRRGGEKGAYTRAPAAREKRDEEEALGLREKVGRCGGEVEERSPREEMGQARPTREKGRRKGVLGLGGRESP
jgi:hypothetical protein